MRQAPLKSCRCWSLLPAQSFTTSNYRRDCVVGLITAPLSCSHVNCLYCWCLDIAVSSYNMHIGREVKTGQQQSGRTFLKCADYGQSGTVGNIIGICSLTPVQDPMYGFQEPTIWNQEFSIPGINILS